MTKITVYSLPYKSVATIAIVGAKEKNGAIGPDPKRG
jgi:hypothetical protein